MKFEIGPHADDLYEVERLTLELHELIRSGHGEDTSADQIREQLDVPCERLPGEWRGVVNNLSGDLYMLMGEEYLDEGTLAEVFAVCYAWLRKDWIRVLILCRRRLPLVLERERAYLRGRAYGGLGLTLAADAFLGHARKRNTPRDS